MELRDFLKVNSLRQVDIARYLGVTEAAISNVVKGKSEFSKENLIKLQENPHGWDTSMLNTEQPKLMAEQIPSLSNVEILLRDMLAEKEAKIDALQELIWVLKEENGRLKEQLRAKGGDAQNAVGSSSAIA